MGQSPAEAVGKLAGTATDRVEATRSVDSFVGAVSVRPVVDDCAWLKAWLLFF